MKKKLSNKYLSIGEVSKIMSVSHTSLRYYDEIGILKPAYTNQDTGYRYYAKNQIPILNLILLAIELGIPLKELEKYLQGNDDADLEKFVHYAKNKLHNSIKKLQRDLYFLESAEKHFKENDCNFSLMNSGETYIKDIDVRYFLLLPCEMFQNLRDFDISDYWKKMTELYTIIAKLELSSSIEQGLIYFKEEGEIISKYFVEIKKTKQVMIENAEILRIPKGEYLCSFYSDAYIEEAMEKHIYQASLGNGNFLIASDILEKKVYNTVMPFEVQFLKSALK